MEHYTVTIKRLHRITNRWYTTRHQIEAKNLLDATKRALALQTDGARVKLEKIA